jgi:adenosine deaminase
MCKTPLHTFLAALPKCEHHIHIEGALTPSLLFELAKANNIVLPPSDPAFSSPEALLTRYSQFQSLDDFLHYYFIGMSVLMTAADFEALAYTYFARAAADGLAHAEVFFDPEAHTLRGVAYETVVAGLTAACKRAREDFGISTMLILCVLRHLPLESATAAFETAVAAGHFDDGTLAGLGVSSTEKDKPPQPYKNIFAAAKESGINRTAHAGEEGPPAYIQDALDRLHVMRIDHGRRLPEDPALMRRVADEGVMLTLCPISNVCLRGVESMAEMPVRTFLEAGVSFSINSDDPAYFGGYLLDNYCAVQETFGLTAQEWKGIAETGIRGSWCDEERKNEMLAAVERCVEEFFGGKLV